MLLEAWEPIGYKVYLDLRLKHGQNGLVYNVLCSFIMGRVCDIDSYDRK